MVFDADGILYPDSVVGTDSHTTMINGLGIVGWGKCTIHAYIQYLVGCAIGLLISANLHFKCLEFDYNQ